MLMDLFSAFDPATHKMHNLYPATWWFINFSYLLILVPTLFVGGSRYTTSVRLYIGFLVHWLDSKHVSHMKGMMLILASSITLTLSTNMIGQLPYTFPITVSPVFSMTLCLPIWFGVITSSLAYAPSHFLGAFIPLELPLTMAPAVVAAELVSNLMRPLTHCVGLITTTSVGHLCLKVSASLFMLLFVSPSGLKPTTFIVALLSVFLIFFEALITLLQSYVFCFLLTAYIVEHPHTPLAVQNKALIHINKEKHMNGTPSADKPPVQFPSLATKP